jgi:hypothetical protein
VTAVAAQSFLLDCAQQIRHSIHDLETRADPAGDVPQIANCASGPSVVESISTVPQAWAFEHSTARLE